MYNSMRRIEKKKKKRRADDKCWYYGFFFNLTGPYCNQGVLACTKLLFKKKKIFFGTIQRYWDMYRTLQNAGKEARGVTAAVDISQAHGIRITQ